MIALIMKDIASLRKTLMLSLLLCLGLSVYAIYSETLIMIPLLCAFMPLTLNAIAFGSEFQSGFDQFAFSLPIEKRSYVFSKLFFPFVFALLASIVVFVFLMIENNLGLDKIILLSIITFVLVNTLPAIQLIFVLKFGSEKGRLISAVTFFIIFALSNLLKEELGFLEKLANIFSKYSFTGISLLIILVLLIIFGIAVKISVNIMQKKEY
ncbi:ABC-2 transporter permease [Anaerococcus sp. mt242]|uniref:ABC-2 transporter permease n=1 Tax=Anaerococcus sp. mt242 TaxID=2661917 RepID=UPI0019314A9A|nr:ABC-2 transporter permease [Anaerococcus sp. mt242]MBM0046006.1 ABC-2 transporter permease [Anaerococcus sp. mt242]